MIEGFDEAAVELQPKLGNDVTWFTPPERKSLVSPEEIIELAKLLLMVFLVGFRDEAMKATGKAVFNWLKDAVNSLLLRRPVEEKSTWEEKAGKALEIAADMAPANFEIVIRQTEENFRISLEGEIKMPIDKAVALAADIKCLAVEHILSPKPIK